MTTSVMAYTRMFVYIVLFSFIIPQKSVKTASITMEHSFWINPCGLEEEPPNNACNQSNIFDKSFLKNVLQHCLKDGRKALEDAKNLQIFLKNLTKTRHPSFEITEIDDIHLFKFLKVPTEKDLCNQRYPTIPAEYNLIQRHAVILQQMITDAKSDAEYYEHLNEKKRSMVSILCSLYELILHLNLRRRPDVSKDIMPVQLRQNKQSIIIMRDNIVVQLYIYRLQNLNNILQDMQNEL